MSLDRISNDDSSREIAERAAAPVALHVSPEEIALALGAPEENRVPRLDSLWHRVNEVPYLTLTLRCQRETSQLVRLRVQSAARDWKASWARWSWPVRFVPDALGGVAASAQDVAHEDGSLSLLLLPNEAREIQLSFDTPLQEARAGDYAVSVLLGHLETSETAPNRAPVPEAPNEVAGEAIASDIAHVIAGEKSVSFAQVAQQESESARWENDGAGVARQEVELAACDEAELARQPIVVKLRHPTARWMGYLPGIYHSSPVDEIERELFGYRETPFFERFLRGFEDAMAPLQVLVSHMDEFFGANSAPPDFLPWLATWVGLALDENWPQLKRRRLIREAIELYRWRGTRRGLERYLEIYCDVRPKISDLPFSGMKLGPQARLGHNTTIGLVVPHTFIVTLAVARAEKVNLHTVRQIIDSQKPAHTAYELHIVSAPIAPRDAA